MESQATNQPTQEKGGSAKIILLVVLLLVVIGGGGVLIYRFVLQPTPDAVEVEPITGLEVKALEDERLIIINKNSGDAASVSDTERGRPDPFQSL